MNVPVAQVQLRRWDGTRRRRAVRSRGYTTLVECRLAAGIILADLLMESVVTLHPEGADWQLEALATIHLTGADRQLEGCAEG